MGEELLPNLHTTDSVGDGGMRHAIPLDLKERHRVGQRHMLKVGCVLVSIADELVCTATSLVLEPFSLTVGLVDVFDVAVIGRNTVSDKIIAIGNNIKNVFLSF